jgi:hypothetical protein
MEVNDNKSLKIANQTFVSIRSGRGMQIVFRLCWERRPGSETLEVENKHRMTHMGHSQTLAICGKMLCMKNLFPGACDEPIECW